MKFSLSESLPLSLITILKEGERGGRHFGGHTKHLTIF